MHCCLSYMNLEREESNIEGIVLIFKMEVMEHLVGWRLKAMA